MPFANGQVFGFDSTTVSSVNSVGAVYGLAKQSTRPGFSDILYVGKTDDLRRRLGEHLNNPPIAGITHFFAELHATEANRTLREAQLIGEFNPPGNTVGKREGFTVIPTAEAIEVKTTRPHSQD